jgi:hypothetical protein
MSKIKLRSKDSPVGVVCSGCDLNDGLYCKVGWAKKHSRDVPWLLHPTKKCPLHNASGIFVIDTNKHW